MELIEGLKTRRSIRRYSGKEVTEAQERSILEAAMYAPSAVNCQPWHFVVIRDRERFTEIMNIHPYAGMLKGAEVAFLVCGDTTLEHGPGYYAVDCAAATQNMLLAIHGLGLGGVWVGIHPREERIVAFSRLFRLPQNIRPFALIACGWPGETKKQPGRFKPERIHREQW